MGKDYMVNAMATIKKAIGLDEDKKAKKIGFLSVAIEDLTTAIIMLNSAINQEAMRRMTRHEEEFLKDGE